MPKNDFSNANIGTLNYAEGNIEGVKSITSFSNNPLSDNDIISAILNTSDKSEFNGLLKKAQDAFSSKSEEETKEIIESIVKNQIDSAEKKESFLQKIKNFALDVSAGFVGGILVEAVKSLTF